MQDFDAFTFTIAEGDPVKRAELERGNLRDYWRTAEGYVTKLAHAHELSEKARAKHSIPSRRV